MNEFERAWLESSPCSPELVQQLRTNAQGKKTKKGIGSHAGQSFEGQPYQQPNPLFEEPERTPGDCRLRHLPGTKDSRTRSQAKRQVARVLHRAAQDVRPQALRRGRAASVLLRDQVGADCERVVEETTPEDHTPAHSPAPSRAD